MRATAGGLRCPSRCPRCLASRVAQRALRPAGAPTKPACAPGAASAPRRPPQSQLPPPPRLPAMPRPAAAAAPGCARRRVIEALRGPAAHRSPCYAPLRRGRSAPRSRPSCAAGPRLYRRPLRTRDCQCPPGTRPCRRHGAGGAVAPVLVPPPPPQRLPRGRRRADPQGRGHCHRRRHRCRCRRRPARQPRWAQHGQGQPRQQLQRPSLRAVGAGWRLESAPHQGRWRPARLTRSPLPATLCLSQIPRLSLCRSHCHCRRRRPPRCRARVALPLLRRRRLCE
jgi:translation initiation factor IF-2